MLGGESASISILSATDSKPAGCIVQSVSASAATYLLVKGRRDVDAEIKEGGKEKLAVAQDGLEKKRKMVGGRWVGEDERRRAGGGEEEGGQCGAGDQGAARERGAV